MPPPRTSVPIKPDDKVYVFQKEMLKFWKESGRKYFPWRNTRDPWKLLIAEILLRKTTATQVISVYERISGFSPEALVEITLDELEALLKPLGIYKIRARQLKNIAFQACDWTTEDYKSNDVLQSIPGIGRYISNSVRCSAFDYALPGLDANMIRVVQRIFGWCSNYKRPRDDPRFWEFAASLVPSKNCREYNWSVLDFAALICKSRNPKCNNCNLSKLCLYTRETNLH